MAAAQEVRVTFYTHSDLQPKLEIQGASGQEIVPFESHHYCRVEGEHCWEARVSAEADNGLSFRILIGDHGSYACPWGKGSYDYYHTHLDEVFVKHGQIFSYQPAPVQGSPRVMKVPNFFGRLSRRTLYVYLPRGYDQQHERRYPVIYMHDGQNCFQQYSTDSFSGSWRADETATRMIALGEMQECIIVGVSNGNAERIAEYLPPYATYIRPGDDDESGFRPIEGAAGVTAEYYKK